MVAAGQVHNRRIITKLKMQNVKPSMASDIWSDGDVSLMATFLYYIDDEWEGLHAMLTRCTGFTGARQTGDNIGKQTVDDLASVGMTFEDVHDEISDQGSNIAVAVFFYLLTALPVGAFRFLLPPCARFLCFSFGSGCSSTGTPATLSASSSATRPSTSCLVLHTSRALIYSDN